MPLKIRIAGRNLPGRTRDLPRRAIRIEGMRVFACVLVATVLAAAPPAAGADGLPLPVEDAGPAGVADADGVYRYVTIKDGPNTLLERIEQDGGEVSDSIRLDGLYTIPVVALDGSPGGLSADGESLVLIRPRPSFPRRTTEFLRFDADDIRDPHAFTLRGDFSFDALSPDGRTMYLIEYLSRRDPTQYNVRAFDLERERLLPGKITDPDETGDEMYGYAASRVTGGDGRWAYTLYWGPEHPFVHALDTVRGEAACIDLDLAARDPYTLGLEANGPAELVVTKSGTPVAAIDTETHAVTDPAAAATDQPPAGKSSPPLVAIAAIGLGIALAAAALAALRRRTRALA
jgi:hypothetical protein